jgi:KUP system potassium uptake protein
VGSPGASGGDAPAAAVAGGDSSGSHGQAGASRGRLAALSLTALGIVFGDIGTSPLYAFKECFHPDHGLTPTPAAVYGVLSLIIWALTIIVSVKYIAFIMRLDNRGEGGILALLALVLSLHGRADAGRRGPLVALGLFGAALLYGDGVITPAISVLSAVEGIDVATPAFRHWVVPSTLVILFLLFQFQRWGTARVGGIFGPVMLVWFVSLAVLGAREILLAPAVLHSLNPLYGLRFLAEHRIPGFLVLGAVVLAVTGAEALYADMGHFGRRPIRLVWFALVFPALVLNYLGQGALVLREPQAVRNPFYLLAPDALMLPLVVVATLATIVASQALISGAFSLTQQAIQLGYAPRATIVHTSRREAGQIYVPEMNILLMLGCLALVLGFKSSSALGAAYGIAVTGTMAITTLLFYAIARHRWQWSRLRAALVAGGFFVVDLAFFGANLVKIERGGWVPLVIAAAVFTLMTTWSRGSALLRERFAAQGRPLAQFIDDMERAHTLRVPGTAVFLTPNVGIAPLPLVYHLRHNKAMQEEVILLSVATEDIPEVSEEKRLVTEPLRAGFFRVATSYGFMERPDIERVVRQCCSHGMRADPDDTTYYLGRPQLLATGPAPMMRWRKHLFAFMRRNASSVTDFFGLPPQRVVEIGARIEL